MRAAPEIKILTGTISTAGVVTFDNVTTNADDVINLGFAVQRASICVQDQGGVAVDWSFKVIGLPCDQVDLYGDLATVGETIADHTDTAGAGAIVQGAASDVVTALFISSTVTDVGTATSFGIQVVAIGF